MDYRGQFDQQVAEISAQLTATVTMMSKTLSDNFQQISGIEWTPFHGWSYTGGKYSVIVGGSKGVVVETDKADFNQVFDALLGQETASSGTVASHLTRTPGAGDGRRQVRGTVGAESMAMGDSTASEFAIAAEAGMHDSPSIRGGGPAEDRGHRMERRSSPGRREETSRSRAVAPSDAARQDPSKLGRAEMRQMQDYGKTGVQDPRLMRAENPALHGEALDPRLGEDPAEIEGLRNYTEEGVPRQEERSPRVVRNFPRPANKAPTDHRPGTEEVPEAEPIPETMRQRRPPFRVQEDERARQKERRDPGEGL